MSNFSPDFVGVESGHRNNVVIGCGSPDKARGKSRNTARYAAFSILATSYGGSDGMAFAMPVTLCVPPVFHTHSSCRPMWKWIGSCSKAQLDSSMSTNLHKVCEKCGGSEFYAKGGCKPCTKAKAKIWYANNTARAKANVAAYSAANPGMDSANHKARYLENPEKYKELSSLYQFSNPEKVREKNRKWLSENPGAMAQYRQNRRSKKLESGGTLSRGLVKKLLILQKGKCTCCGKSLGDDYHLDHIMPLALGGANTDSNIQLLRKHCNLQKHAKHPVDFMQERGFLL